MRPGGLAVSVFCACFIRGFPITPLLHHSIPQIFKEQPRLPQSGSDQIAWFVLLQPPTGQKLAHVFIVSNLRGFQVHQTLRVTPAMEAVLPITSGQWRKLLLQLAEMNPITKRILWVFSGSCAFMALMTWRSSLNSAGMRAILMACAFSILFWLVVSASRFFPKG
jgi:hypothetical protein